MLIFIIDGVNNAEFKVKTELLKYLMNFIQLSEIFHMTYLRFNPI